ncbi:MAG: alpha/beta hydrolase, partial [Bacteroidota bacterium]
MRRNTWLLGIFLVGIGGKALADPGTLIRYEKVSFLFKEEVVEQASTRALQELCQNNELDDLVELLVKYPLDYYRIVYETTYQGEPVTASGLLIVPHHRPGRWPLLSYQHGTILPGTEHLTPSEFSVPEDYNLLYTNPEVELLASVMAANGYVVAMPDYLGYGESGETPIQYTYTPSLAEVSRDMLRAAQELCWVEDIALSEDLFLAGWSEGAGATMALHRLLEAENDQALQVTASSPLSGYYNYSRMFREFASSQDEELAAPIYLWSAWILNQNTPYLQKHQRAVYRHYYHRTPEHFMLKAAWLATREKSSENLLNPVLRQGLIDGTATDWLTATQVNDHFDWYAEAPVFLHHGAKDNILPLFHSEDAYHAMQARGSTVKLYNYAEDNHFTL